MAEFKIALGASADVVSGTEMDDKLTGLQGRIEHSIRGNRMRPIRKPLSKGGNITLAGAGSFALGMGRPALGKIWSLASLTLLGADDGSAVAGLKAAVYIGDPANPSLNQCIIPQQSIPFFDSFGFPDYWIHDQNDLFINYISTGAVAGQVVVANAWVMEYNDDAVELQTI